MGGSEPFPKGLNPTAASLPFGKDKKNFIADFSNIGPETDLTGPGVGVISTVPSGFGVMSGTSMATPAETGAAARLLATKPQILKMPRDQNRAAARYRNRFAIAFKTQNFEPGDTPFLEAAAIVLNGSFLRRIAHAQFPLYIQ